MTIWAGLQIHPAAAYRSLLVAVAAGLILTLLASAVLGDRDRGGWLAIALILFAFEANNWILRLILGMVVVLIVTEGLLRRGTRLTIARPMASVMSAVGIIVGLAAILNLVQSGALARAIEDVQADFEPRGATSVPEADLPDILVVLLDGYPGDAAASLEPSFDSDELPNALARIGFHVQRDSRSNYLVTPETLASVFEMRHLVDIPGLAGPSNSVPRDHRLLRQVVNNASALDLMHAAGYELHVINSGFVDVELRRVDQFIDTGQPNEFELGLVRTTGLRTIIETVAPDLPSALARERVTSMLATFRRLATEPHDKPRFVFAHIPSPHAPWVFGADGEPRTEMLDAFYSDMSGARRIDRATALRRAFDQATYIGRLTAQVFREVLSERETLPVVVLFSDHGPGTGLSFADVLHSDLSERSSNFMATLTPGDPRLFGEATTPVNIFPILLTRYLGADVAHASNAIYAWRSSYLDLVEVTELASRGP